jgi:hypothetical protein
MLIKLLTTLPSEALFQDGSHPLLKFGQSFYRSGLARIYACGHDGSVSMSPATGTTSMSEAGSKRIDK